MKPLKPLIAGATICVILTSGVVSHADDHEGGVFVRAAAGVNTGSSDIHDQSTGTRELSGTGLDFEGAAGMVLSRNLAVHATILGWRVYDPGVGKVGGTADGHITLGALGAGVTYFIMPTNVYFSTSVAASKMRFWVDGVWWESGTGLALEFVVGKEWFVGGGLGIGGSVGVLYHSVPDGNVDANWSGLYLPIRFSATFN